MSGPCLVGGLGAMGGPVGGPGGFLLLGRWSYT